MNETDYGQHQIEDPQRSKSDFYQKIPFSGLTKKERIVVNDLDVDETLNLHGEKKGRNNTFCLGATSA